MIKQWNRARLERALETRGFYDLGVRCDEPAIFIGGCARSGTTLFKSVLDRHPRIGCGPETSLFGVPFHTRMLGVSWEIPRAELDALANESKHLTAFAGEFFRRYLLTPDGKQRWADKTPNNVRVLPKLLTWYPNSKFIHLIRDGRDVACSLRNHRKERIRGGKIVPKQTNKPISVCARAWLEDTSRGLVFKEHPRCLEVRYERFLDDPEKELRRVCGFLDEDFDPRMLDTKIVTRSAKLIGSKLNNPNADRPIERGSLDRWKKDLSAAERRTVEDIAGPLLRMLGYTASESWVDAN